MSKPDKVARMPIVKNIQAGVFKIEAARKVGHCYPAEVITHPSQGKAMNWFNYPLTGKAPM